MAAAMRFLRTPSVGRSVVALLSAAILLLLIVNVTTFVMIQRTAAFNDQEADLQATRRLARKTLITPRTSSCSPAFNGCIPRRSSSGFFQSPRRPSLRGERVGRLSS